MENPFEDGDNSLEVIAVLLAGLGSLNWGLIEAFDYDLTADLLSMSDPGAVYLAVGVAGGLVLTERLGLTGVFQ